MRKIVITTILFVILAAGSTHGAMIEIGLTAEITGIDDGSGLLEGKLGVGDTITGSYKYDSETPDTDVLNHPGIGQYQHSSSPYGINLSGGGFIFQTDPDNVDFLMGILDNYTGQDSYGFVSYNNPLLSNGVAVDLIFWQLDDYSCTALSSDALPTTPPVLGDYPDNWLAIELRGSGEFEYANIGSEVTSVWLIPEPATALLLALGGLSLLRGKKQ